MKIKNIKNIIIFVIIILIDVFGTIGIILIARHGSYLSSERQSAILSFILLVCITTFSIALTGIGIYINIKYKDGRKNDE